jgi:hypothetical protein
MKKMVDYGDDEPVLQRRLMIVTDDYILMTDYLKGNREHTFDWLLHPVGYQKTIAENIKQIKHTEKMSDDPNSSYSYITDCDWSEVSGSVLNQFKDRNVFLNVHAILNDPMTMAAGTYPFPSGRQGDGTGRKTLLFRTQGKEFRFISLLEPYLEKPVIKSITVNQDKAIVVSLADGRIQTINIINSEDDGRNIEVRLTETQDGKIIRTENTKD